MEKIILFNDFANTQRGFQNRGMRADFAGLLDYLSEGRFLVEAHAYVPVDPRNPHGRDGEIEALWRSGYLVHSKVGVTAGETYKCDFDVEITMDLMRTAELAKPDIIVLMSGDKDFVPVILELRKRGIRVEVAAFAEINASRETVLKASGFIDLGVFAEERQPVAQGDLPDGDNDDEGCADLEAGESAVGGDGEQPYPAAGRTGSFPGFKLFD